MGPFLNFYTGENNWNEENKTIWLNKRDKFSGILRGWSQKLSQWLITENGSSEIFLCALGVVMVK